MGHSLIPTLALIVTALNSGCAAPPQINAFQHYDQCALEHASFAAMATCGKQQRTAYCQARNNCSALGNTYVAYADSLVVSVNRGEMTEAEASRKWIEFRTTQLNALAQAAAGTQGTAISGQAVGTGQRVYDASECIGPVIMGECKGSILPSQAVHPTCHGQMINGQCTGPMF